MVARRPTATAGASGSNSLLLTARQPGTSGMRLLRSLTVHQKASRKAVQDPWHKLITSPGTKARKAIVELVFSLHELSPAEWTRERVDRLMDGLKIEQDIEDNDPISLHDAIYRTLQDVHALFCEVTSDEMKRRLFSPISEGIGELVTSENMTPRTFHEKYRPSHTQLESQWMSRWIYPTVDDTKRERDLNEWTQVIGFAGEFLVFCLFQAFIPDFSVEENWTSAIRRYAFPDIPEFGDAKSFSDFTYYDATGSMAELLNIPFDGRPKRFYIEVKTSRGAENGFAFSSRQFNTMRNMFLVVKAGEDIVYVIVKVDNAIAVRDARITQIIEDPFRYFVDGKMDVKGGGAMRASWK